MLTDQEFLEHINSCPGWKTEQELGIRVSIVDDPLNNVDAGTYERIRFDPIPVVHIAYYPFCDCGEPVLERQENMAEPPLVIMGYEYMETCYECQVVSSD